MWLALFPVLLMAQPKDNSPYSDFGIGDIVDRNYFSSQFMGGQGAAFHDPYEINLVNPASLGYLNMAAFDVGVSAKLFSLSDASNSNIAQWSGRMNHLSLAFPFKNSLNDLLDRKVRNTNIGMAFSLKPYSSVGYLIQTDSFDENIGNIERQFRGSGGTFDFSWSTGVKHKNFSGGLSIGRVFGKVIKQSSIGLLDQIEARNTFYERTTSYRGFIWRFGAMYDLILDKPVKDGESSSTKKRMLTFGIHGNSATNYKADYETFEGSAVLVSLNNLIRDTFNFDDTQVNLSGKLPAEIGAGVMYKSGEKFSLGLNMKTTTWSQFVSPIVNDNLKDAYRLSFGGYYRPNYKSINNYFSRVKYNLGVFYEKLPFVHNGEQIDDIGLSFGMGLPFFYQRKVSHANLGLILGTKGRNAAIQESYFRVMFSFTFNDDEWFLKRKYN